MADVQWGAYSCKTKAEYGRKRKKWKNTRTKWNLSTVEKGKSGKTPVKNRACVRSKKEKVEKDPYKMEPVYGQKREIWKNTRTK